MKNQKLFEILGDINEKHIITAKDYRKKKISVWFKWGVLAACFAVVLYAGSAVIPLVFDNEVITSPTDREFQYEKGYFYHVDAGPFSAYIGGKVISDDKIGGKLSDVSVTAGWKNEAGEWISTENLRGEIFAITGISDKVAAALKFLDKGEAITTTHYYVIMNPEADLTSVAEYYISPFTHGHSDSELAEIIPE